MTKLERNVVYSLPLISVIFEIIRSFWGSGTQIMGIRNYLFALVILFLIIKYFAIAIRVNFFLIVFIFYLLILLAVLGDKFEQFNEWIRAFDAKMLLPLGFILTFKEEHLQQLNKRLLVTNFLFVVSIIIFSALGIGRNQYGANSGFSVGYFSYSNIYTGAFLLIILPIIYIEQTKKVMKYGVAILGIVTFIILVLSVRRTSIVIVFIGALVYMYLFRDQLVKIALNAILVIVIIVLAFPLYGDMLQKQVEARSNVFNENGIAENLEKEYRLLESIAVWNERIQNPDLRILLFGQHLFDSPGNYNNGVFGGRPIHLDLNLILHGSGLVGLILLIVIYFVIFIKFIECKVKTTSPKEKLLVGAFFGIFLSLLFLLFSGGMLTITFNMIAYLYLGSLLGLFKEMRRNSLFTSPNSDLFKEKIISRKAYIFKPKARNHNPNLISNQSINTSE